MSKRNSRAEWLQAKAGRKVTARLLSELLLTRDDKLERFRMARATAEAQPDLQRLREVQGILTALATAIQRGDDGAWSRIRLVWQLLVEDVGDDRRVSQDEPSQPGADSQSVQEPEEPQEAQEPEEPVAADDESQAGGLRKPNLADPAPPGRPSRPSGLAAPALPPRPASIAVSPVVPRATEPRAVNRAVRPSQDSDEHTDLSSLPNPQPVMPFRPSLSEPTPRPRRPGRVAPPDPSVPAPPLRGPHALRAGGVKPPWPGPEPRSPKALGDEATGLTAVLDADAVGEPRSPALPFAGASLALLPIPVDGDDGDDVTEVLESPLPSALAAPVVDSPLHDPDEGPTMLSGPGEPNPMAAAVRAHEAYDWDELGHTPTWDELPWAAETEELSRHRGSPPADASGPPSSTGNGPFRASHEEVETIVGQPPVFLARLQSITLDQYASVRAECELFPERIDEVRRVVGLADDAEMKALDDLWRQRFSQTPPLQSQFEQAVARYRVWLRQKGKD